MVRKKMKQAAEGVEQPRMTDPSSVVLSWLKDLSLLGHRYLPVVPPKMDIFSLLDSSSTRTKTSSRSHSSSPPSSSSSQHQPVENAFAQVRGLQALRAAVVCGKASNDELRLVYLVSLILFIDPDTSVLRKSIKGLLLSAEKASKAIGSNMGDIVEIVVTRFIEYTWDINSAHPTPTAGAALRIVVSLQWLLDIGACKEALLEGEERRLFCKCIGALHLSLEAQSSPIKSWSQLGAGNDQATVSEKTSYRYPIIDQSREDQEGEVSVSAYLLSTSMSFCSEVLKAAACVMSLTKKWEVAQLPGGGDSTVRRICELCLLMLAIPTVQREASTHASAVLVHLGIASWRVSGRYPQEAGISQKGCTPNVPNTPQHQEEDCQQVVLAASTIANSFFSRKKGKLTNNEVHAITQLIASSSPLPPGSSIAVCRALVHIVDPRVLLASYSCVESEGEIESGPGSIENLFLGPILCLILSRGGANTELQLRFLALQVLQAWCSKAKEFADHGYLAQDGDGIDWTHLLGGVMDVTLAALMHPSRLISSMAPLLLEHVVDLRHVSKSVRHNGRDTEGKDATISDHSNPNVSDKEEWERLVGQVMRQSAPSKGKYIALSILLPKIGAVRMLELFPSIAEQLVWAVGMRENVSGQATSLLLQFLKAITVEVSSQGDVSLSSPARHAPDAAVLRDEKKLVSVSESKTSCATSRKATNQDVKIGARGEEKADGSAVALCRKCWVGPAAAALMQEDSWSRGHVAAYFLPEVFRLDPGSVSHLADELRTRTVGHIQGEEKNLAGTETPCSVDGEGSVDSEVRRMWARIEAARYARKCGSAGGLSLPVIAVNDGNATHAGLLQLKEVKWAALHVDETLRMSALCLLCTDVRMTTVPVAHEMQLLEEVLPYSLKVFDAQSRQLLLRALQTLLARMRETVRVCTKEPKPSTSKAGAASTSNPNNGDADRSHCNTEVTQTNSASKRQEGSSGGNAHGGGWKSTSNVENGTHAFKPKGPKVEAEGPVQIVERVEAFVRWLSQVALESLYPGCPFEREVLGLEIVQLVLSELVPLPGSDEGDQDRLTLSKVASSSLFCRRWVDTLLALLGSSWDRTRSLAYAILSRFPRPLAGYEGHKGAAKLSSIGLRLAGSGRQRESDKGALILRLVFVSYAMGLGLRVPLLAYEYQLGNGSGEDVDCESAAGKDFVAVKRSSDGEDEMVKRDVTACFLEGLCDVLKHRLDGMRHSFDELLHRKEGSMIDPSTRSEPFKIIPFPHGLLLAVHHVLLDSKIPFTKPGRSGEGRKRRGAKARPIEATSRAQSMDIVQLEHRRLVMGLLLKQALRALRLSLLIVGEKESDGIEDGGSDCAEGSVENMSDSLTSGGGKDDVKRGGGVNVTTSRPAHNVNANGHIGMVAVDNRGHVVSTPVSDEINAIGTVSGDGLGAEKKGSAAMGQRAVVGAWLLAKEACRCLATMVIISPLPFSGEHGEKSKSGVGTSAEVPSSAGGMGKADAVQVESNFSLKLLSLLKAEDVAAVGETLLDSLLSLKHMGCVASAQAAFQAVCEALLVHGRAQNSALSHLPYAWLDKLIGQLTGVKKEFVLRRSAGLALAFMAILRAEPRSVTPVLLPLGMRHLLALANSNQSLADHEVTGSENDWKGTVHALNVLRVVFVDATLADDVGPYVTKAMMAAVCGFEDPIWAVRNSSMMLFSSIMQKAVGGAKNTSSVNPYSGGAKRPHSGRGAVTVDVFFQQHPKLQPFLLSQLERAADHMSRAAKDTADGAATAEMHPVLYPVLLLLARLQPSTEAMGGEVGKGQLELQRASSKAFVPPVIRCAGNPHFLARAASARALAALVPPAQSPGVIMELLSLLPKTATDVKFHNHIHGTLLQVLELLLAARARQSDCRVSLVSVEPNRDDELLREADEGPNAVVKRIAYQGSAALLELLWLADPALSPCPPIRYAMLRLLEGFAGLRGDETGADVVELVQSALQNAEEANFADANRPGSAGRVMPGRSLLVSTVVASGVRRRLNKALFEQTGGSISKPLPSAEVEVQVVVGLLRSPDMDVRDAAIKTAKKVFSGANLAKVKPERLCQETILQVWTGAATALTAEVHPPNVRRLVRLLSRISLRLRRYSHATSSELLWNHLRGLCEGDVSAGSEATQGGALEVMGVMIQLAESNVEDVILAARVNDYTSLVENAVDPEEPTATRMAAVVSLASSQLLWGGRVERDASTSLNRTDQIVFVRLWFVALSLLQDDDENVRIEAARAAAAASVNSVLAEYGAVRDDISLSGPRGGGRVELCAVDSVLAQLVTFAGNGRDQGCAAEELCLSLLRVFTTMPRLGPGELLSIVDSEHRVSCSNRDLPQGGSLDESSVEMAEDAEVIFGREERKQFQEPALFACAAAPYLFQALVELHNHGSVFPDTVTKGLAGVLDGLTESLEALGGSPRDLSGATWLPGVYQGVVSYAAMGEAVLTFTAIRSQVYGSSDGHLSGSVDLPSKVSRAVKACEEFGAVLGQSGEVHPRVASGVRRALSAAKSPMPLPWPTLLPDRVVKRRVL